MPRAPPAPIWTMPDRQGAGPTRLDVALVERGLCPTRARARAEVLEGRVRVGGRLEQRPAARVSAETAITLDETANPYVSRGGLKLAHALDQFAIPVEGATVLDIGASTGGFTDVVLSRGAARVYAVDVGHGQLSEKFRSDPRVISLEGTDARSLDAACVPEPVDLIVCDVSFISATLVLPPAAALAAPGARMVVLVKPQFEAGRAAVGKGGLVRDAAAREAAIARVTQAVEALSGWQVTGCVESPVTGGSGNVEFLLGARHRASRQASHDG